MLNHFQGYSVPVLADKSYFSFKNRPIFSSLPDYTYEVGLLRETDGMVKRNWARTPRPKVPVPALLCDRGYQLSSKTHPPLPSE